ncbi:hypothetical protein RclHR1_00120007 [Rhizophagus clarus]|uniref:Uncharacterized protein n=1 Tax=Rhizophagus clarus TaxID=94130 RepID=A0A2Z6Q5V9_9GLOM|nr:hypothetical protein RclHR1_00120007 [Rhizophagus clarus]GES93532.1 hypothetical protein RCL_jg21304.t1 [Rhizophagus clarus]
MSCSTRNQDDLNEKLREFKNNFLNDANSMEMSLIGLEIGNSAGLYEAKYEIAILDKEEKKLFRTEFFLSINKNTFVDTTSVVDANKNLKVWKIPYLQFSRTSTMKALRDLMRPLGKRFKFAEDNPNLLLNKKIKEEMNFEKNRENA